MESESQLSYLKRTCRDLGIEPGELQDMVARELGTMFRENMAKLRDFFKYSLPEVIKSNLQIPLRTVSSHLNGDCKPGKLWKKYEAWFRESIDTGVEVDEQEKALGHLERAGRIHDEWKVWSKQGRKRKENSLPANAVHAELLKEAIQSIREHLGTNHTVVLADLQPVDNNGLPQRLRAFDTTAANKPNSQSTDQRVRGRPGSRDGLEIPPDLQPPPWDDVLPRPHYALELSRRNTQLVAVLQGPAGSGKSHIILDFIRSVQRRILWYHLTDTSTFVDMMARVAEVVRCPNDRGRLYARLIDLNFALVLDGISQNNYHTFIQSLQVGANTPGPTAVWATSVVRIDRTNAVAVSPLSVEEIGTFLSSAQFEYDHSELESNCRGATLYPLGLARALASHIGDINGVIDVAQWNLGIQGSQLGMHERQILDLLRTMGPDFDLETFKHVLHGLEITASPTSYLEELEFRFAIRRLTASTWRIEIPPELPLGSQVPRDKLVAVLTTIAQYWENSVLDHTELPKQPSYDECMRIYKACRCYQLAGTEFRRKDQLLDWLTIHLRAQGSITELRQLCHHEVSNNKARSRWIDLRLAKCLHIQGDLQLELDLLQSLFYDLSQSNRADPNIYMSVLRALAELLIDVDQSEYAVVILDAAIRRANISQFDSTVVVQAASILSWAFLFSGRVKAAVEMNEGILGRQMAGFETRLAEGG